MGGNPEIVPGSPGEHASPEEIVKRRYARGEITRGEYLQMMGDLSREE